MDDFSVLAKIKKQSFSKSSRLKGSFEKLHFRDGLLSTIGLTIEIKLRFKSEVLTSRKKQIELTKDE